jgi:hypothetical protein
VNFTVSAPWWGGLPTGPYRIRGVVEEAFSPTQNAMLEKLQTRGVDLPVDAAGGKDFSDGGNQ